jgi:hypothetical protein
MHEVGREYGRAHRITLSTLQRYVPRSNDPGCSAGFGMGLVMYLGPQLLRDGGRAALRTCTALPTRYRGYTCVHGLGHALMRVYHGDLRLAVRYCRSLPRYAADCAQGAFHDYWISLRGADGTTRPARADTSPRSVCNGQLFYVRPCWYRYFLENPTALPASSAADILRSCRGLRRLQRSGCIAGAALNVSSDPFEQTRMCSRMSARDADSCLRGVGVQAAAGKPARELALIAGCRTFVAAARRGCYEWFGRTLNVVTNGSFLARGCARLAAAQARSDCRVGARRIDAALVTFS